MRLAVALALLAAIAPLAALAAGARNCVPGPDALAEWTAEWCSQNGPGSWCLPCDAGAYVMCPFDEAQPARVERCAAGKAYDAATSGCADASKARAECTSGVDVIVPGDDTSVDAVAPAPLPTAADSGPAAATLEAPGGAPGQGEGDGDAEFEEMGDFLRRVFSGAAAGAAGPLLGGGAPLARGGPLADGAAANATGDANTTSDVSLGSLWDSMQASLASAADAIGTQLLSALSAAAEAGAASLAAGADGTLPLGGANGTAGARAAGQPVPLRMSMVISHVPKGAPPTQDPEVLMSMSLFDSDGAAAAPPAALATGGAGGGALARHGGGGAAAEMSFGRAMEAIAEMTAELLDLPSAAAARGGGGAAQLSEAQLDAIAQEEEESYMEEYEDSLRAADLAARGGRPGSVGDIISGLLGPSLLDFELTAGSRDLGRDLGGDLAARQGGALGNLEELEGFTQIIEDLVGGDPEPLTGEPMRDAEALANVILDYIGPLAHAAALDALASGAAPLNPEQPPRAPAAAAAAAAAAARARLVSALAPLLRRLPPAGAAALAAALAPAPAWAAPAVDLVLVDGAPELALSPELSAVLGGGGAVEAAMKLALDELFFQSLADADLATAAPANATAAGQAEAGSAARPTAERKAPRPPAEGAAALVPALSGAGAAGGLTREAKKPVATWRKH
ncbi:MAG: hypothetical protein J3K34DRAFT_462100 [Monoraphidium minutum]|nr:MAG: hypothetical protein J3K34DRAFT_462100 [Monoraphidium minutum]